MANAAGTAMLRRVVEKDTYCQGMPLYHRLHCLSHFRSLSKEYRNSRTVICLVVNPWCGVCVKNCMWLVVKCYQIIFQLNISRNWLIRSVCSPPPQVSFFPFFGGLSVHGQPANEVESNSPRMASSLGGSFDHTFSKWQHMCTQQSISKWSFPKDQSSVHHFSLHPLKRLPISRPQGLKLLLLIELFGEPFVPTVVSTLRPLGLWMHNYLCSSKSKLEWPAVFSCWNFSCAIFNLRTQLFHYEFLKYSFIIKPQYFSGGQIELMTHQPLWWLQAFAHLSLTSPPRKPSWDTQSLAWAHTRNYVTSL